MIVSRLKPDTAKFYYGAILAEKTVVTLIKNDPKITIIPSGNYFLTNFHRYQLDFQFIEYE